MTYEHVPTFITKVSATTRDAWYIIHQFFITMESDYLKIYDVPVGDRIKDEWTFSENGMTYKSTFYPLQVMKEIYGLAPRGGVHTLEPSERIRNDSMWLETVSAYSPKGRPWIVIDMSKYVLFKMTYL